MKGQLTNLKRSSKGKILKTNKRLTFSNLIVELSDASNTMFMVLDSNRQIVLANKKLLQIVGLKQEEALGLRPGELFKCSNALEMKTGCGTHPFCSECGAAKAISDALNGKYTQNECRISCIVNGQNISFDLLVQCQKLEYLNNNFVLMSVIDISDLKRREILEKTFFHDILNTAGGVYSFAKILKSRAENEQNVTKIARTTYLLADRLVKEIKGQQLLLSAEKNSLRLCITDVDINRLIIDSIQLTKENSTTTKSFRKYLSKEISTIKTDEVLLQRVIINLLKNAAEASSANETVSIRTTKTDNDLLIRIHNKSFIPKKIQYQLFQRSFSTKGKNRGIGTYSVKLFTENYMKGKVWFKSTKSKGTYFYVQLPLEPIN